MSYTPSIGVSGQPIYLLGSDSAPLTTSLPGPVVTLPASNSIYRTIALEGVLAGDAQVFVWLINPKRPTDFMALTDANGDIVTFASTTGNPITDGAIVFTIPAFPDYFQIQAELSLETGTGSVRLYII